MVRQDTYRIIVTRSLDEADFQYARHLGLDPVCTPMLKIQFPVLSEPEYRDLKSVSADAWIFTSRNGVEGLERMQSKKNDLSHPRYIFAVGDRTAEALQSIGLQAVVPFKDQNAKGLAELISGYDDIRTAIHFTGSRHRPELKEELDKSGIELIDVIVYRTKTVPEQIQIRDAEAILFYSPSAVKAFAKGNDIEGIACFAIGPTTANALHNLGAVNVIQSGKPDTRTLLQTVRQYLEKNDRTRIAR